MQKGLRQIVEYTPQNESQTFGKTDFYISVKSLNLYYGFMENRLGQNVRNDRGIISGFHQKSDFDSCFAGQSQYFPKQRSLFLFKQSISLWMTDM